LVVALIPLRLRASGAEDVFDYLARLNALDRLFFGGFVSVRNGRPKDIFDHASRKAFYEELDRLRIPEVIAGDSGETFEVVGILIDLGPFQAEGF